MVQEVEISLVKDGFAFVSFGGDERFLFRIYVNGTRGSKFPASFAKDRYYFRSFCLQRSVAKFCSLSGDVLYLGGNMPFGINLRLVTSQVSFGAFCRSKKTFRRCIAKGRKQGVRLCYLP